MDSLMLAGTAGFDLDHLCRLIPADLNSEVQEKVGDLRLLMLSKENQFVAQLQPCDEEEDEDTREDLRRISDPPPEFADALGTGQLRFLIVTYAPDQRPILQRVIDALAQSGVVHFVCNDDIQVLTP